MNRDLLRTLAGVFLIGAIVVGVFLYGNEQREAQNRRDQQLAEEQQAADQTATSEPSQPGTPETSGGQGGGTLPSTTPEAGPELVDLVPATGLLILWRLYRRTKRELLQAQLKL